MRILAFYKNMEGNSDDGYIFPILYKRHATVRSKRDRRQKILKRLNKDLKTISEKAEIQKNLTTYVASRSNGSHKTSALTGVRKHWRHIFLMPLSNAGI